MIIKTAWTHIAIERIVDIFDGNRNAEKQAEALARLFQERGLDITKPHEKLYKKQPEAWLFRPADTGELITVEVLQP
jgi:transposase